MSQFNANAICAAIAGLANTAWNVPVKVGLPVILLEGGKASVICEDVQRIDSGGVHQNRYSYTVTVYGRFPKPESGSMDAEKDARANELYDEVVTSDGRLYDAGDNQLAYMVKCVSFDRRDYVSDGEKLDHYDVALTFTMQADVPRVS